MSTQNPFEILLIEDSPDDAFLTEQAFQECVVPVSISVVDDGTKAIKYLHKAAPYESAVLPEIILLDLNLPKKSGIEVLKEIKGNPQTASIPILVLSTSQNEEDVIACYEHNANSFISKPVDYVKFVEIVKSIASFWFTSSVLPRRVGE